MRSHLRIGLLIICLLMVAVAALAIDLTATAAARIPHQTAPNQETFSEDTPVKSASPDAGAAIITWEYDQVRPKIAYNSAAGNYLVVWEDHHWGWGDDWDIYARFTAADGAPQGTHFGIAWDNASQRTAPDIAFNTSAQNFLVVWEYAYSVTDHDIYARRVGSDGALLSGEIAIATTTSAEGLPAIVYNPTANEYLVVWRQVVGSDEFKQGDIYAQRVNASGAPVGSAIQVAGGALDETAPAAAYDASTNRYMVVWQGRQSGTTEYGIYGQRVAADGALAGAQIAISTWEGDQLLPQVAYDSVEHRFLVVWEEHHWGEANGWHVYGQMVGADGALVGSHLLVSGGAGQHRLAPDVTYLPAVRSYLVVWEYAFSATDHDVYARRVAYDGTRPESEFAISSLGSYEGRPAGAAGANAAYLLAWEDGRNQAAMAVDIYGAASTVVVSSLTGRVYIGASGVETTPLPGATVQAYCSNAAGDYGAPIGTTMTNAQGEYTLPIYGQCEYYHLVETDPPGYISSSAASSGGAVVTSNWIRYTHPLAGKTLTGNNFWDYEPGPVDAVPPGNWTGFEPGDWRNSQTVDCSIRVEDTASGLDVASARFAFSTNGGGAWSEWRAATCTGASGATSPQTIQAASIPFGQDSTNPELNRCKFSIADMAGNRGESSAYNVLIDTTLPQNPVIVCPNHAPSTWSKLSQVNCQWSGASDALSGVGGYTLDWNQSPSTIPALPMETSATEDSLPLADGNSWYLHVRTVDRAGNGAAGATHYGPIYIDTQAPTAWLTAPASGVLNVAEFTVAWAGGDTTSGVANFDVQTSTDGATWSDWRTGVTEPSAPFTGQRGQTHYFRVRARDHASNVGAWSTPVHVSIGVNVAVRVRSETGTALQNAKVYHNGAPIGVTSAAGTATILHALLGDQVAALYPVYQAPAAKPNHGWVWRVYQTSIQIPNSGAPQLHIISNTGATQELTVRKNQALIGMHVVVSIEWDANSAYLNDVALGVRRASAFLYDVTDGQMFWEVVDIYDNNDYGKAGDMNIYASNQVWPNAFIGAIADPNFGRMYMPRDFGGNWSNRTAFSTMIHEFGHYGLWLYDEYLDRDGKGGGFCTHNRDVSNDETTRASIMDDQTNASELCSKADAAHLHNTNTEQDKANNGESTWETVIRKYSDSASPTRWTWQSPDTRQVAVVPGPTALPIPAWVSVNITDRNTAVCAPYTETVTYAASGAPAVGAEITLERTGAPALYQGTTDAAGRIVVLGAHNGDTLRAVLGNLGGARMVACTPALFGDLPQAEPVVAQNAIAIEPEPFALTVQVIPSGEQVVEVRVASSQSLPTPPTAQIWQAGADEALPASLTYHAAEDLYIGHATLNAELERRGAIQVDAIDGSSRTMRRIQEFALKPVQAALFTPNLASPDGNFDLVLSEGALTADAYLSIHAVTVNAGDPGGRVRASQSYHVALSTGQEQLNAPAVVNLRYRVEELYGVAEQSLRLYRWADEHQQWVSAGAGDVHPERQMVSTTVNRLGTYALFGEAATGVELYLPVIVR
jgi:hypothetical protein